jgi:hypothetical protein
MQSAVARRLDENVVHDLIASEIVLPAQYWDEVIDPRSEPEKRLMVAVLEEAVTTLLNHSRCPSELDREVAAEARRWIASNDRSGPFTFATICDVLELEASRVRQAIQVKLAENQPFARRRRMQAGRGRHRVRDTARRDRQVA